MTYSPECVAAFEALAEQNRWDTDKDESGYYIDWSMTAALAAFAANWERVKELEYVLSRIVHELPSNKDWLDPALEAEARKLLDKKSLK